MSKKKYMTIGSVIKGQDSKPDYIKITNDVTLKKGQFLNLRSKKQRLESLDAMEASGKLSGEILEKLRERAAKIPDFVRFEIELVTEE